MDTLTKSCSPTRIKSHLVCRTRINYTYLQNIQDLFSDGKTPCERRFGKPFNGQIILFGSLVEYCPIFAKDQSRIHQFGEKIFLGLFLGYALYAGGIWKGDVLIADLEELETMDASTIYSKRLKYKGSNFTKITAKGEVQTHEEAIVFVELDVFLTLKVLENTPAALSLGKLCDENGHSYEWINGQKPHLIKDGIRIICNTEKIVRSCCGSRLVIELISRI